MGKKKRKIRETRGGYLAGYKPISELKPPPKGPAAGMWTASNGSKK